MEDRASMERYFETVAPTFAGTGMKPLSIYQDLRHVEGAGPVDGIVLLEFPDMETANRWYESPAYQAIRHHRTEGADSEIFFFDGGVITNLDEAMPHTKGRIKAA